MIVPLIIGLAGALVPAPCWLIYRLAVLQHLSRVYEKGGAHDVQAMANAVKTALPPPTYRPWQLRGDCCIEPKGVLATAHSSKAGSAIPVANYDKPGI